MLTFLVKTEKGKELVTINPRYVKYIKPTDPYVGAYIYVEGLETPFFTPSLWSVVAGSICEALGCRELTLPWMD